MGWLLAATLILCGWLLLCLWLAHRSWRASEESWSRLCGELNAGWEQNCRLLLKEQKAHLDARFDEARGKDWTVPGDR